MLIRKSMVLLLLLPMVALGKEVKSSSETIKLPPPPVVVRAEKANGSSAITLLALKTIYQLPDGLWCFDARESGVVSMVTCNEFACVGTPIICIQPPSMSAVDTKKKKK